MTKSKREELNKLFDDWERLERLKSGFLFENSKGSKAGALFLIGGGNFNPSLETWDRIRTIVVNDLDQKRAEAKVEFENA